MHVNRPRGSLKLIPILIGVAFLSLPVFAFADTFVVFNQPNQDTNWTTASQAYHYLPLGPALASGTLGTTTFRVNQSGGPWDVSVVCSTDAFYNTPCAGTATDTVTGVTLTGAEQSIHFGNNFSIDSTKYYRLAFYYSFTGTITPYGAGGALPFIYSEVIGTAQSIVITSPLDGSSVSGNTTTLSVRYVNPNGFTQMGLCVYTPGTAVLTAGICANGGQATTISSSGVATFSVTASGTKVMSVYFGQNVEWLPVGLGERYVDSDAVAVGFGGTLPIYTVGDSQLGEWGNYATTSPQDLFNCTWTDVACGIKSALSWLFYPSITVEIWESSPRLASTSPYGYIPDILTKFQTQLATTSASTTIGIALDSFSPYFGTSTIEILSANKVQSVIGPSLWNLIQNLLKYSLWLLLIAYIWRLTYTIF